MRREWSIVNALTLVSCAVLAGAGLHAAGAAAATESPTLVRLRPEAACRAAESLARAGATDVAPELALWRLEAGSGAKTVKALQAQGAVASASAERRYVVASVAAADDPLVSEEWWRSQVGIDGLTPPGSGVPVTLVDSGVNLSHPEFAGRVDTEALNAQEPAGIGGVHGTEVASVLAAPRNGLGLVGVYPDAQLRIWDAARGVGTQLDGADVIQGIVTAARTSRGVINLSLGGPDRDPALEAAVAEAVRLGSLVVAASGNDGLEGSPLSYPAALPHVLTVAATDETGSVASFSSRSRWIDLAAPGTNIPVADAATGGWTVADGTSFATPIVSGAAAWLWTARPELDAGQVSEILRRSSRDIDLPGRDAASGFGLVDLGAALAAPTPVRDGGEPNDGPNEPASLTTPSRAAGRVSGRVDAFEDPRDVMRVWVPAGKQLTATLAAPAGAALALYNGTVRAFAGTPPLARATLHGAALRLTFDNRGRGRWSLLVVKPPRGSAATYTAAVSAR